MRITFITICIAATLVIAGVPTSFYPQSLLAQQDPYPESQQAFERYNQTKTPPSQVNATEAVASHINALSDALNSGNLTAARHHSDLIETQLELLMTNESAPSTAESGPIGPAFYQPDYQKGQYQPVSHCYIWVWNSYLHIWEEQYIIGCY
jgi:hypothetical protein